MVGVYVTTRYIFFRPKADNMKHVGSQQPGFYSDAPNSKTCSACPVGTRSVTFGAPDQFSCLVSSKPRFRSLWRFSIGPPSVECPMYTSNQLDALIYNVLLRNSSECWDWCNQSAGVYARCVWLWCTTVVCRKLSCKLGGVYKMQSMPLQLGHSRRWPITMLVSTRCVSVCT